MNKKTHSHDSSMFPVIKISSDNRIIYHNVAAMPLMSQWNCELNKKVPATIMKQHPVLFSTTDAKDIAVLYKDYAFSFSVVPFPEAGYTGVYGYSVQQAGLAEQRQTTPQASAVNS